MKTIAHISDLHFGTEDPHITTELLAELDGRRGPIPSLVAVSGDLSQRARISELAACRSFLDRLPGPYLVVPGNHDVPLFDLPTRFMRPFERYRQIITSTLCPSYVDDELAAVGINTAHGFTFKGGRITREQAEVARAQLTSLPTHWKVVVAHHPFVLPAGGRPHDRVLGADEAIPILEDAEVNLILSGHLHVAYASDVAGFRNADKKIVAVHAGTCISTRLRGEPNGYNHLTIVGDEVTIVHRTWSGDQFVDGVSKVYRRQRARFVPVRVEQRSHV
ncbi:MAG: metallophosphoesterase [Myxococcales bacterium]|nr:metallophosphoesterase [Myxococcales bacterium]